MLFSPFSKRPTQSLGSRFALLLLVLGWLLLSPMARGQVTYTGSGAVNFGSQAIGTTSAAQTLTFSFSASTKVGGVPVVTQGATGLDFVNAGTGTCHVGTTYTAGASCTIHATFSPKAPGPRYGAAEIHDSSGNVLARVYMQGAGTGPQVNFEPGVQTNIPVGGGGMFAPYPPFPTGVAVDASGNVYFSDLANCQVVEATPSAQGYATGALASGFNLDFYPSLIPIWYPEGLAVDGAGNVFVSEFNDGTGALSALGQVATAGGFVLASGLAGPGQIAVDGSGSVYVVNNPLLNNAQPPEVLKFTPSQLAYTQSVIATSPNNIQGIAVDGAGNVYFSTTTNANSNVILKLTLSAGNYVQSTVVSGLSGLPALAVDGNGNVYFPDGNTIVKEMPSGGSYTQSVAASGDGLVNTYVVAVDSNNNLYVGTYGTVNSLGPGLKVDLSAPPSLSFANTTAGLISADSPQTVQVSNIGSEALVLTGISFPPDFPEASGDPNACSDSTSLSSGQECDLPIEFTPQTATNISERVTVTDNSLNATGTQQSIVLSGTGTGMPSSATHFSVAHTASVVASSPFTLTVKALDAAGSTATTYDGSVVFTSSDPLFVNPGVLALSGGVGQAVVTLSTLGTQTITATDTINSALTGSGSLLVALTAAPATTLGITVPASATAGRAFPFTVTALDAHGSVATSYAGTVSFSSTDPSATLPGSSTLVNGTAVFAATLGTAGQQTVSVTDSTNHLSVTSTGITVALSSPATAPNEWTWMNGSTTVGQPGVHNGTMGMPFPGNTPGALNYSPATWTDKSGNFWLFGGGSNDLWEFNPSLNEWAWMGGSSDGSGSAVYGTLGVPAAGNIPGDRSGASAWTDNSGKLWLFGGSGGAANGSEGYLNDIWEYDPAISEWAWMGGSNMANQFGVYGTRGTPEARSGASAWTDSNGHFWLFGGVTFSGNTFYYIRWYLNDLWEFDPATNEWTWVAGGGGSPTGFPAGDSCDGFDDCGSSAVYGSLGTAARGNTPGGRVNASSWTDSRGNLWLFGGLGFDAKPYYGWLNDVWEFNPSVKEWSWMGGSSTLPFSFGGQPGVYGTLGTPSAANIPGGRLGASTWTDHNGLLWLFGGGINDLWAFNPSTNEWAWMGGSSGGNQSGVYGTLGTPSPGNIPGTRSSASTWTDNSGNLWLFGGNGLDVNGTGGNLNDLWEYEPPLFAQAALTSPALDSVLGSSATFTWSSGTGVTNYEFWLGTTPGSHDLYNSGHTTANSTGLITLPTDGVTIYGVLWSYYFGAWHNTGYTFFEGGPAAIESPAPGSVLGLAANFVWSPGTGGTMSSLALGNGGPGSSNLYNSGPITSTSATVTHLPSNGGTINARLGSYNGTTWSYTDYTYTAAAPYVKAALLSPSPGTVLGSSATFTWSAGTGVTAYAFWLGTTQGSSDLYNSGHSTALSSGPVALPANDVPIYATLFSYVGGEWLYSTYVFIEAGPPKMLSPEPGGMLGFNATFMWSPGTGGTMSSLTLGTAGVGSSNLYNSGPITATSATVTGLPTSSATIYARLGSYNGTAWTYTDYIYTESPPPVRAVLVSPAQGSTLSSSQNFTWSAGTDVAQYAFWLGTTRGGHDIYNSGHKAATSTGTIPVPTNGATIYGQLFSYVNGVWQYTLYTFKEQ